MPVLSMFYGIIVRMYSENGGKHNVPHIHAIYSENEVVVSIDGIVLEGSMPNGKMKLLQAWIELHREELYANWELLSAGDPYFKIEPLR